MTELLGGVVPPTSIGEDVKESGPYILSKIHVDPPLSQTAKQQNTHITCAEFWNGNLYIGTSGGEILHYVLIPSDGDYESRFTFASGSQLSTDSTSNSSSSQGYPGVRQVLILPRAAKACILCNGWLTFCSLPELSPAFPGTEPIKCNWIGGLDLDSNGQNLDFDTVMITQKRRISLVDIDERRLRKPQQIPAPGFIATTRRGNIVCVADAQAYSLLDIVEQQMVPLFEICTAQPQEKEVNTEIEVSNEDPEDKLEPGPSHTRSASLGIVTPERTRSQSPRKAAPHQRSQSVADFPPRSSSLQPTAPDPLRTPSPATITNAISEQGELSEGRSSTPTTSAAKPPLANIQLPPHIVSPLSTEFLLTTGTSEDEPGVGMFVNLDGDPVRGTVGFSSYPLSLIVDGEGIDQFEASSSVSSASAEGFILAIVKRTIKDKTLRMIEVQRWDVDAGELGKTKYWLTLESSDERDAMISSSAGIRTLVSESELSLPSVTETLALKRLGSRGVNSNAPDSAESDGNREKSEVQLVADLSSFKSNMLVWSGDGIYWVVRNPLLLRLDAQLVSAFKMGKENQSSFVDRKIVEQTLNTIRGQDAQTPLEFFSLKYIRQKASLALFMDLLSLMSSTKPFTERDRNVTEEALSEGEIDPRIVLTMLPILRDEVVEGTEGIWVQGGLVDLIYKFLQHIRSLQRKSELQGFDESVLQLIKRYLFIWRQKKGLESVQNAKEISQSVDAALLHLLLILDSESPRGPALRNSIRSELNNVVDHGIDCFDRGVELLEKFHRLFVLSRLYQHYRMRSKVLATWRRIMDGERDDGGEFDADGRGTDKMCNFLSTQVTDESLVREYGVMLAKQDPQLGIRVFGNTDPKTKVKFSPEVAIEVLREGAPNAVKDFIEYLVFEKNLASFANTLISFYLDSLLMAINSPSSDARAMLTESYSAYRALQPPKPTYSQFIADNTPDDSQWARNRLRLLQLLGGSHGAASQYDVPGILDRIKPHADLLIPETIVLAGRQGQHREAIHLLTHGLGDIDTAIRYCVLGGSSTYSVSSSSSASTAGDTSQRPSREEQEHLFRGLLSELITLSDDTQRLQQTSQLLERYGHFFEIGDVLTVIPEEWSLTTIATFLTSALRALLAEQRETSIERALASVHNLNISAAVIEKISVLTPSIQHQLEGQEVSST